jgi:hypothetical protein
VTVSYQVRISDLDWKSMELWDNISSRICLVSLVGMLEYMLAMSSEANPVEGVIGICLSLCISCVVFLMLKVYDRGVYSWMVCDSSLASLYAGALRQLTMGHIWVGLFCVF